MPGPVLPVPKPITAFAAASQVLATDVYLAVDTTDTSMAPTGTDKKYTMAQLQVFDWATVTSNRPSCRVVSVSNQVGTYSNGTAGVGATFTYTSTGVITIDSVTLNLNDRVLLTGQSSAFQNGIYYVSTAGAIGVSGILTRALDYNSSTVISKGTFALISEGTIYSDTAWQETGSGPFTIGTTAITFSSLTGSISGIVPLNKGGTNENNTAVAGAVAWCNASGIVLSAAGLSSQLLYSNGTSAPAWTVPTYPVASGSLNTYLTSDGTNIIYSTFTLALGGNITTAGALTLSGAHPAIFNFSNSTNVTFPVSGTLATTSQIALNVNVTTATQAMASNTSYTVNDGASLVTFTLPLTSAVGDVLEVIGNSSNGWSIIENSGQNIQIGGISTAVTTGSVSSANRYDCIRLKCTVANTTWVMQDGVSAAFVIV